MKIYLLLAEDPFYTLPLVKSIVEKTEHDIVGAAFLSGFINLKRITSTLFIYGVFRFIKIVAGNNDGNKIICVDRHAAPLGT